MKEIALNGKYANGKKALVDDLDYESLKKHSWSVGNTGYPRCTYRQKQFLMHDLIMPSVDGIMVDHKNQDKLDNRRDNLRYVTKSQNMQNQPKNKRNSSRHKGVYFLKSGNRVNRWFAKLVVDGIVHQSDYVATKEEAAKAAQHSAVPKLASNLWRVVTMYDRLSETKNSWELKLDKMSSPLRAFAWRWYGKSTLSKDAVR